jgi:multicomponent Na+:H+ antiporter subunit G
MKILELLLCALLLGGCLAILVAALGVVRLPDVYCRSHAMSKGVTFGLSLLLVVLMTRLDWPGDGFKALFAIVFLLVTIPVAGHLLCRLARRRGMPGWKPGDDAR